ncbi:hypothetical protein J2792_003926 [Novosphingobium capsulatum]|uniref:Uncharacterized protein n=1 Tax=Novosphingobium capsulatum TaxID=13688 RepID=A0ABU1MRS3_9SPHN|nr:MULTISPECIES: hypothetical protein [Novosphingobium]MDR6513038.1 hypothetical protein [Novosphingobium capsulatum]WQD93844.1 hypothetical protein U0041_04395 [Novosphingobium capsulatum]
MAETLTWQIDDLPPGFAWDGEAEKVLQLVDGAFAPIERPVHFTDVGHCCECLEHDKELKARPRMALRRADLGHAGWDPVCFTSVQGVAYLMPALARYTMAPDFWPDREWYAVQMVSHLTFDGPDNRLVHSFDVEQKEAIAALIAWCIAHRAEDLAHYGDVDAWLSAAEIWQA